VYSNERLYESFCLLSRIAESCVVTKFPEEHFSLLLRTGPFVGWGGVYQWFNSLLYDPCDVVETETLGCVLDSALFKRRKFPAPYLQLSLCMFTFHLPDVTCITYALKNLCRTKNVISMFIFLLVSFLCTVLFFVRGRCEQNAH
jgi:hypothetical protein